MLYLILLGKSNFPWCFIAHCGTMIFVILVLTLILSGAQHALQGAVMSLTVYHANDGYQSTKCFVLWLCICPLALREEYIMTVLLDLHTCMTISSLNVSSWCGEGQ